MFVSIPKRVRRLAAVAIIATLAVASLGFAASNTVPASKAGDGSGAISGYTVSAVHYNLNSTDPATIDAVTFALDSVPASGSTIRVKRRGRGNDVVRLHQCGCGGYVHHDRRHRRERRRA